MKSNFIKIKFERNKKASVSLSLETLVRLLLSSLILVVLLGIFLSITNLDRISNKNIAIQNAKSIGEFIDYTLSTKNDDCFSMLKLYNLENFQGKEEGNNYVYIITKDGVFVEHYSFAENLEQRIVLRKPVYSFEYNNFNLVYDNTITKGFWNFFSTSSSNIILGSQISYILLKPDFSSWDLNILENQNNLKINYYNPETNKLDEIKGNYLIIKKERDINNIFISNGNFSNSYAKNNLCLIQDVSKATRVLNLNLGNGENIDYLNYKVSWNLIADGNNLDINFKWDGIPKCYNKNSEISCNDLFSNTFNLDKISYLEFINLIKQYAYDNQNNNNNNKVSLNFVYEEYSQEELNNLYNKNLLFKDLFHKYNNKFLINEENQDIIYPVQSIWLIGEINKNIAVNGCNLRLCQGIILDENNKVNFHILSSDSENNRNYYSFSENYLRKDNQKNIYFNGNKINNIEEISFENGNKIYKMKLELDNLNLIKDELKFSKTNFDILISEIQYKRIPYLRLD